MKVVKTIVFVIIIILLIAVLWFLINFPAKGNPATKYCVDKGGTAEIRNDSEGNQYGVCVFSDDSECDEWKYYRNECQPGTIFPETSCQSNIDCVTEFCCHSSTCVNMKYKSNCTGIFCTQECMPGTMDCNQGNCVCLNNTCRVEWIT